jgi:TetR/AcrR family transcriptional repressor of nem operon
MKPFGLFCCKNLYLVVDFMIQISHFAKGVDWKLRKGQETRQMIISKSSNHFNRKGYASSSISEIMEETGLKKGGIYRHFDSKKELTIEAFEYSVQIMTAHYRQAIKGKKSMQNRIFAILSVFQDLEKGLPLPGGCPLMNGAIEFDDTCSELASRVRSAMTGLLEFVEGLIVNGQETNEFSKDVNAKQASIIIISTLEGGLALSRLYQDSTYLDNAVDHLQNYIRSYSI